MSPAATGAAHLELDGESTSYRPDGTNWITLSPTSGSTPAIISVSINAGSGLRSGRCQGTITVSWAAGLCPPARRR